MPSVASIPITLTGQCPLCTRPLALRERNADRQPFIGCSGYPACRFTSPFDAALQALYGQITRLQAQLYQRPSQSQTVPREVIDRHLRALLLSCHPDRWHGHPVAEELSKAVLDLRAKVQGGAL